MVQMGFYDLSYRYASLDAKKDPLLEIDAVVPWEEFRPALERVWRKRDAERKSRAGRKPMDAVLMFKTLVLSALYNLSDDQIEYQVRDRLSFMRFLGLGLEDRVPDAKTVWLYRDALAQAGKVEELFNQFDGYLGRQGYVARGGQILDASIVPVPRNHNTREENATIKDGEVPEDWADKPAKRSQKDVDARWTKKHGKSHYGYKNHVNVDRKHKLVRRYHVSDAAQHDRWDGCRPPRTASQCAKVVVLKPLNGKDGNSDDRYNDWGRSGKEYLPGPRRVDERRGEVPKETVAPAVSEVRGSAVSRRGRDGSLLQRALLGAGNGEARP